MRILLDENFPTDLARHLVGATVHTVHTVHSLGWGGTKNGELLRRAGEVCDVFVTLDRNLVHQQNLRHIRFGVVVVRAPSNRMLHLLPLVSSIIEAASGLAAGAVVQVGG